MSEQTRTALELRKEKAVVTWQGRSITITFDDVKRHICPKASDQEVVVFLKMAQSLNLNPWAREVYLIKYSLDEPASYVIAEESYLKAAEQCSEYTGHEAGIIVKDAAGNITYPEGTLFIESDKVELVGGWARVYRKDRKHPFFIAVNFKECAKHTRKGELNRFWDDMPATMIRKVALSRALREAFPSRLGGMVTDAEWEDMPEELFPEMLLKDGKPNWPKFYAKISDEFKLTAEQAHKLVGVEHFSTLLDKGWTMEGIWDTLLARLKEKSVTGDGKPVDQVTGDIKEPGARSPQLNRNPESIKDINELLRACFDDFGLQPPDVAKELGYSSTQEITKKPSECYLEIKAVRE
jgi:phage recombination protein Bet